jgi:hypothetical protein
MDNDSTQISELMNDIRNYCIRAGRYAARRYIRQEVVQFLLDNGWKGFNDWYINGWYINGDQRVVIDSSPEGEDIIRFNRQDDNHPFCGVTELTSLMVKAKLTGEINLTTGT